MPTAKLRRLWFYASCGILDGEEYKGSVAIIINGGEFIQFGDEDVKIIVTGNSKVWDVSIAEIRHWWE